LCVAALIPLGKQTRFTYFPQDDASEFEVNLQTPEGTTLEKTAEICSELERRLKAIKMQGQQVVLDTLVTVGETSGSIGKAEGSVNVAVIYCRLPQLGGFWETLLGKTRRWSQFEGIAAARKILTDYPDVRASVQNISAIGQGGRGGEMQFNVIGPDLER